MGRLARVVAVLGYVVWGAVGYVLARMAGL